MRVKSSRHASVPESWRALSISELFETIMSMSLSLSQDRANRTGGEWRRKPSELSSLEPALLCQVSRSILDGAKAFDALLEEMRAGRTYREGHFGQFVEFGKLAFVRKNPHMSPAAKTVVFEAMDRVLACRPMERRFRSKQPRPPDLVDLSEASRISGISRQNMKKLMSAHFFEVKRGGHRGLTRWVKRSDVVAVAAELNATIPDFAVEKQLGIDRQQFCLLETAGLLVRPTSALRPLLPTGTHYTAASVEALLVRLHRPLDDKVFAVPLSEAALTLSMAPVPWAAILIVVATEAGYGATAAKGSSDWRASTLVTNVERFKIDVKKAADAFPVANQILSTAGAAEILGTTPNFVRRIAKLGVLRNLQGRPARFDRQSIVCFRKEYIYGNALARHFGVSNNNATGGALLIRTSIQRSLIFHGI